MTAFAYVSGISFLISLIAIYLSSKRYTNSRVNRRIRSLEVEVGTLTTDFEKQLTAMKTINARLTMRARRAEKKESTEETPEEWKARKRIEIAQGKLGGK